MDFKEHAKITRQTWNLDIPKERRQRHAVLGLIDELGEIASCLKKEIGYGKELDKTNMKEEIGDFIYFLHRFNEECEYNNDFDKLIKMCEPKSKKPFIIIGDLYSNTDYLFFTDKSDPVWDFRDVFENLIELMNCYGFTIAEVLNANVNKLKARYGNKLEFSQESALNRNLENESKALNEDL